MTSAVYGFKESPKNWEKSDECRNYLSLIFSVPKWEGTMYEAQIELVLL